MERGRDIPKITDAEWAKVKHVGQDGVDASARGVTPVKAELHTPVTARRSPSILGRLAFWKR